MGEETQKMAATPSTYKAIPAMIRKSWARNRSCTHLLQEEDLEYLEKNTNLDKAQLEEQHQAFPRNHPDGKICKKSFCSMLREGYPGTSTSKLSRHIWRIYDTNIDGFIDFKEFMMALYVMSSGSSEENLKQIFRVFDINSDGTIDVEEMKWIVKDLSKHDGDLSDIKSVEQLSNSAFYEMDENVDGKVSQEEFSTACLARRKSSTELAMKIVNIFIEP